MTVDTLTSLVSSYLPQTHASLLNGILFGVNINANSELYQNLRQLGLLHMVVLSGINITLLVSLVGLLCRPFGKYIWILMTTLVLFFFIRMVGPEAPIIRAGIMGLLTLVSIVFGRKTLALYALFISALVVGIFKAEWIQTVSFQLSFGATLGIILFGSSKNESKGKLRQFITKDIRTSLSAQVFAAPIIFIYFKQISLIAPLSNLLVAFTIGPLMLFGFAMVFLGKIHFMLGIVPAYVCYGIISYILFIVDLLSRVPFMYISL